MNFKAYNYSCLMAVLPDEIASRIRAFSQAIPDSDIYEIDEEEYGRPSEIHCTVKYGIHTADPEEVEALLAGHDLVRAELRGITVFDNPECIVLKIDVESPELDALNALVSDSLKCTDSHPVYKPHVTIAYLRHRAEDPKYYSRFLCGLFEGTEVWFDRLHFSTAAGNRMWIGLAGGFNAGSEKVARIRRIANRMTK
jgi:2'-5' RNA ligase